MFVEINDTDLSAFPVAPMNIHKTRRQCDISRPDGFWDHQFIWVIDGEGFFEADGKVMILSEGQGMFMRKTSSYAYSKRGDVFATRWVSFRGGEGILEHYGIGNHLVFDVPDFLDDATDQLEEKCHKSSVIRRSAHMYEWMTELFDSILTENIAFDSRVNDYLEYKFAKPLSLDDIAAKFGVSKYRLCHAYNEACGDTVINALKKIRIKKARSMLRNSQLTVEEISILCGYDSPSYFIKVFRSETGLTPNKYRNKQKNM